MLFLQDAIIAKKNELAVKPNNNMMLKGIMLLLFEETC